MPSARMLDGGRSSSAPSVWARLAVAILFASVAGFITWRAQYVAGALGGDHLMLWRAAHIVIDGGDPYRLMWWMDVPALHTPFNYPLPAVGMGMPFMWMRQQDAAIAFVASSAALLGYALTRSDFARVPLVLSVPFVMSAQLSQTSFLILALALIPEAAGLTVMKPNTGLALFAWRPSWRTAIVASALLLGSILVSPGWVAQWLELVRTSPTHHAPWMTVVGAPALLAILRWRRPEARLLVAMTLIPHGLYFYDELSLWLVANTQRQAMLLAASSWLGWLGWIAFSEGPRISLSSPWSVASLYLPCVVLILLRRNEGPIPRWAERAVSKWPTWLRGAPTTEEPHLAQSSVSATAPHGGNTVGA